MARAPFTEHDIEEMFTYHAPSAGQVEALRDLCEGAKIFAKMINELVPNSPDKTVAIRKLHECVMTANAAIVLRGRF